MRTLIALVSLLCLFTPPLAVSADKYDPYFIDKKTLKKQYKRIALSPVEASASLAMPDAAKAQILALVTKHLEKRGFTVTSSETLGQIRKTMIDQVGGLKDPATGEIDADKVAAVRDHSWRELWFRNDLDAVATVSIQIIQAPVENDKAEWDGVSQKLKKKGRLKYTASVAASTVALSIYDRREQPLYVNYGGLEVLMMRNKEEFIALDSSEFFQDEKRIKKATGLALKPI